MKKRTIASTLLAFLLAVPLSAMAYTKTYADYEREQQIEAYVWIGIFAVIGILVLVGSIYLKHANKKGHEQAMQISRAGGHTLLIDEFYLGHQEWNGDRWYFVIGKTPDIRGQWGVKITIRNSLTKDIKYCTFSFTALNEVGDTAYCAGKNSASVSVKATGPVRVGEKKEWELHPIWQSEDIRKVRLDSIAVEYMDGTTATITGGMMTS